MVKKSTDDPTTTSEEDLFAPCGMYCGLCSSYLAYKHNIPKRQGVIFHCKGCRPRDKQCAFMKKHCILLGNHELKYCSECKEYPCANHNHLEQLYNSKYNYSYSFQQSLREIGENGYMFVIDRLKKEHGCPKCGEILCIHNGLCYRCDINQIAIMKNYRNDPK